MNYAGRTIEQFVGDVASEAVTPAAGSVVAVAGASGAALLEMVCIHTVERTQDGGAADELQEIQKELRMASRQLLELSDADAEAVDSLLGMPEDDESSTRVMRATSVPLATADVALTVLTHGPKVLECGTRNAVPDGMAGSFLTHSAIRAAVFIARCNLGSIDDTGYVENTNHRAAEIERSAEDLFRSLVEEHGETDWTI